MAIVELMVTLTEQFLQRKNIKMRPKNLPRLIDICRKSNVVPFLIGEKGVGKSQVIEKICEDNKEGFIDIRLGQREAQDLIGLPRDRENTNEQTKDKIERITTFIPPKFIEEMYKYPTGILFFDEVNRALPDTLQAMFQILLPSWDANLKRKVRKVDQHVIPDGWSIVCAGNPDTSEYMVQTVDTSFLDRLVQVVVDKHHKDVIDWTRANLKDKDIARFIAMDPVHLGKPETVDLIVKLSGRSYEFIDRIVENLEEEDYDNGIAIELFQGILGREVGTGWFNYKKENFIKPLKAEKIINNEDPKEVFYKNHLSRYLDGKEIRTELLNVTNDELLAFIKENKILPKAAENIVNYLSYIPEDMVNNFISKSVEYSNSVEIISALGENHDEFIYRLYSSLGCDKEAADDLLKQLDKALTEYQAQLEKKSE